MERIFNNETILVAGAGGLLGRHIATALLNHGARVLAADINIDSMRERFASLEIKKTDKKITFHELDVTNASCVKDFFARQDLRIDGAVNSTYPRNNSYGEHFFDVSLENFNENLSLQLGSAFLFTQQCAIYFKQHLQPFSLVNMSSIYGVVAPNFEIYKDTPMTMPVEYAAIKSAIQHMNKYASAYVKDSRFRINCVSPGGILDNQPEAFLKAYRQKTHGAGLLDAGEAVGPVLFLLSGRSRYVTGQNIVVDDGYTL